MFVPGYPPSPFVLSRHLPQLGEGIASVYGARHSQPGDLVIDPFGQSPRTAIELAQLGRRVIVANGNRTLRFALNCALQPVPSSQLRAALTRLSDSRVGDERLESRLRSLYLSTCPDCGRQIEVDIYVWEKQTLVEKIYFCQACGQEKTRPADANDQTLAAKHSARGPHYHWALAQLAPPDHPDRPHLADALDAYTPRALHVIFNLTYKSQSLDFTPDGLRALQWLLLTAYDEALSLEGIRPRSLKPHVRYRERNIWLVLERAATESHPATELPATVPLDHLLQSAQPAVALFDGSARELADALPPHQCQLMIAAVPRLNTVLWTLMTAWAAWLWGEGAGKNFARRRYDWSWHEQALRSGFAACRLMLADNGQFVALLPEADPSYFAATLTAADAANFALNAFALRPEPAEAQLQLSPDVIPAPESKSLQGAIKQKSVAALAECIARRNEPVRWGMALSAAFVSLARHRLLRAAARQLPDDLLDQLNNWVEEGLTASETFVRLSPDKADTSPRTALWWLADSPPAAESLADRVERAVAAILVAITNDAEAHAEHIDRVVCQQFTETQTPDAPLVRACLQSYGEEMHTVWHLRAEDQPDERAEDVARIGGDLQALGRRFGYAGQSSEDGLQAEWRTDHECAYRFFITDSAAINRIIFSPALDNARRVIVLPGGRAGLVEFKLRRDACLRMAVEQGGWMFLKFRHARRLLAEPSLNPAAMLAALGLDPILEQPSTQLPLL